MCKCNLLFVFLVPEVPTNFSAVAVSSTAIQLSWSAPAAPNGILLSYTVAYADMNDDLSSNNSYVFVVYDNNTFGDIVTGLNEHTPYVYSISANTIAGSGDIDVAIESTFEDRK